MTLPLPGRIAVVSVHADPTAPLGVGHNGGMNLAILRLYSALAARGITADIFTRRTAPAAAEVEEIAPGLRVVRVDAGPAAVLPPGETLQYAATFAEQMHRYASGGAAYSLMHAHHWTGGAVAQEYVSRWPIAWVQSFHTLAQSKTRAGIDAETGRAEIERALVKDADLLVLSPSEVEELRADFDDDHYAVVELGADAASPSAERIEAWRSRLSLSGKRVVLYAGRLEPLKGADTLLEAIACLVSAKGYRDVVALVVGDDAVAGERERLQQVASNLAIDAQVQFLGAIDHDTLTEYYAFADICVVPSRSESFGLVALEAQAAGVPVVAANVGGLRDIVVEGTTGFLVPAGNAGAFCNQIGRLLNDPAMRAAFGEAARQRAKAYTWDRAADQLQAAYSQLQTVPAAACG